MGRSSASAFVALALVSACSTSRIATPPTTPGPPSGTASASSNDAPILPESAAAIGFARMAKYPEPGWQTPRLIRFSPDGKIVTFLQSESQSDEMALFELALDEKGATPEVLLRGSELATKKESSLAQELRDERQRKKITGITEYVWAKKAKVLVIPYEGDVYLRDASGKIDRITSTEEPEIDPQICADGSRLAYVRGSEIYTYDLAAKKEAALTHGAKPGVTRGQSDFNGQEEFDEPSGLAFSPDCKKLVYWEVDESAVKEVPVMGFRKGAANLMNQKYPLTGGKNPKVTLEIADVASKRSTPVSLPDGGERYLGRMHFSDDGAALFLQSIPRSQKELEIIHVALATAKARVLFHETPPAWAEMSDMRLAKNDKELVFVSEKDGHAHLRRLDAASGADLGFLTAGAWDVTDLVGYDAASTTLFFSATKGAPTGKQLFSIGLSGGEPKALSSERGTHDVSFSDTTRSFVDVHSASDRPPAAVVRSLDGAVAATLPVSRDADFDALRIRVPDAITVPIANGVELYGKVLAPRQLDPSKRYPLIVMVYGGPGYATALDRWSPLPQWQHFADRGFFVMQVDNRGSSARGPGFAKAIAGHLGQIELDDQLAALDFALNKYPVDPRRVGIYGHSYGGFMAALAMLKAPGRFRAGVAGSPVTDFRTYDTGYTERYMGTPEANVAGYDATDLTKLAGKLEGDLFVIHALMDENVHFENTARLIDALVAAQKPFDLLVFPGERHGYRSPIAKEYASRRVVAFFADKLAPGR